MVRSGLDFEIAFFWTKRVNNPWLRSTALAYLLYLLVRLISFPSVFKLLLILCGKKSSVNPIYCPFLLYCRCCSDRQSGHIYLEGQLNSQKNTAFFARLVYLEFLPSVFQKVKIIFDFLDLFHYTISKRFASIRPPYEITFDIANAWSISLNRNMKVFHFLQEFI